MKFLSNKIVRVYCLLFFAVLFFLIVQTLICGEVKFVFLKGVLRYFSYLSCALYVSTLNSRKILLFFKICILFLILTLPFCVFQIQTTGRYNSIFPHANHLGYVLVICSYFVLKYKPFKIIKNSLILWILIISLILTASTGSFLTFSLLAFHYYYFSIRKYFMRIFVSCFLLLGIFSFILFSSKITAQLDSLQYIDFKFLFDTAMSQQSSDHYTLSSDYGSFIWRVIYWFNILISFFDNNLWVLIFGEGIDTLTKDYYVYKFMYTDPHNDYVKVIVEFGFLGFGLFLLLLSHLYAIFKSLDVLIIFMVPFFFANIIISWPFNMLIILYLIYAFYRTCELNNLKYNYNIKNN